MDTQKLPVFLDGDQLYLRPLHMEHDLPFAARWINDPDVRRFIRNDVPLTWDQEKEWFAKTDPDTLHLAVVLKDGDRFIGIFTLFRIDRVHRNATVGAVIGEQDCWGNGYGTEVLNLLLSYAFRELNLHRLQATAIATNERSIRMQLRCGFREEGRCQQKFFIEGAWVDEVVFGVLREDWLVLQKSST